MYMRPTATVNNQIRCTVSISLPPCPREVSLDIVRDH